MKRKKRLYVYIRMSGGESSKMECLLTETEHREEIIEDVETMR